MAVTLAFLRATKGCDCECSSMANQTLATNRLRTLLTTTVAMVAFAANSVICRLALGSNAIDAASFTSVRIVAGALTLLLIIRHQRPEASPKNGTGNFVSAVLLFLYAIAFSYAYRSLSVGTGALILFGCVQLTMLGAAIRSGARPSLVEWSGLVLALAGLVWLVLPGLSAPSPTGAVLMSLAGIAWGLYSLRGRKSKDALGDTAGNFMRSMPFAIVTSAILFTTARASLAGLGWAALSGAVTSGLGYVVWYSALRHLTPLRAAIVQLSVPVIAALAGVGLLGEAVRVRLLVSASLILGGIAVAVLSHRAPPAQLAVKPS